MPLALAVLAAGCTEPAERAASSAALAALEAETYAWAPEPIPGPERGVLMDDPELMAEARGALESALAARGFQAVGEEEAEVMLAFRVDVTSETRTNDPFFSVYSVERFENGHLTLAAFSPLLFDELWQGTAKIKLRDTERAIANQELVWTIVEETRSWDFEGLASNLAKRLERAAR